MEIWQYFAVFVKKKKKKTEEERKRNNQILYFSHLILHAIVDLNDRKLELVVKLKHKHHNKRHVNSMTMVLNFTSQILH